MTKSVNVITFKRDGEEGNCRFIAKDIPVVMGKNIHRIQQGHSFPFQILLINLNLL